MCCYVRAALAKQGIETLIQSDAIILVADRQCCYMVSGG